MNFIDMLLQSQEPVSFEHVTFFPGQELEVSLGSETRYPVTISREVVSLIKEGYDNGVNCSNFQGMMDAFHVGEFDPAHRVMTKDNSYCANDEGLYSRHGGYTPVYHYDEEEQITLAPGEWALVYKDDSQGGEIVLHRA